MLILAMGIGSLFSVVGLVLAFKFDKQRRSYVKNNVTIINNRAADIEDENEKDAYIKRMYKKYEISKLDLLINR